MSRLLLVLLCGLLSGCVSTVSGTAMRPPNATPIEQPQLTEGDLDRALVSASAINGIMDARGMQVVVSSQEMSDNSAAVSDRDCLAAMYGGEQLVYSGSEWTALRDEVVQEPNDDNHHWVEQIAVLYPNSTKAREFVEQSKDVWQKCAGKYVDVDNGDLHSTWFIGDFRAEEPKTGLRLTQVTSQSHAGGWGCQHALTSSSNLVVEVWACSNAIQDEAMTIAEQMVKNVT